MVHRRSHHRRGRRGSRKNLLVNGLENVGSSVRSVATKSGPAVKSGLGNLFGLLSKGVRGVSSLTKGRRRRRGTRRR
jgi:hypothetical protein